jgi:hypothetical protein
MPDFIIALSRGQSRAKTPAPIWILGICSKQFKDWLLFIGKRRLLSVSETCSYADEKNLFISPVFEARKAACATLNKLQISRLVNFGNS